MVYRLLAIYGKAGLVMSSDKFTFGEDAVEFAGMQVTQNGVRPGKEFLPSFESFPGPTNISEVSQEHPFYGHPLYRRSLF